MTDGGFAKNRPWRRTYVWAGVAAVVVVAAIAATVWTTHANHRAAPRNDCSVVEELGPKWNKMQQTVATLESSAGETKDLLAIADAESAMADDIRAAHGSVSAADIKTQLSNWAQGTAMTAKTQREAATPPANPSAPASPGADNDRVHAATLTFNATAALKNACPQLQLSQTR